MKQANKTVNTLPVQTTVFFSLFLFFLPSPMLSSHFCSSLSSPSFPFLFPLPSSSLVLPIPSLLLPPHPLIP